MKRTEPFYVKFDKIKEMLKNTTDHTPNNVCKMMLEAGFQVNDTFVAVCDEENWTYVCLCPNKEWAKSEAMGKYYVEEPKRLKQDGDDYYWESVLGTLKTIEEIEKDELLLPVEYDSIKKTIWIEEFMMTIDNCPSEEELDPELINEALYFKDSGVYPFGSITFNYPTIKKEIEYWINKFGKRN